MANKAHVALLEQGVQQWNAWRRAHLMSEENSHLDLSETDLSGRDLTGAMFADTNLRGVTLHGARLHHVEASRANFQNVDFQEAHLGYVDFGVADLRQANFVGAHLVGAYFSMANLQEAIFRKTSLMTVNFVEADLSKADLTEATLGETIFGSTNLKGTGGLESCHHNGPSVIDFGTFAKSGPLPIVFLRGCGLPDGLIDYLPSLLKEPIQFYSCFISYSARDEEFARRLHADLQENGVRCWFAPEDMKIGDKIRVRIDESIRIYDKLLLILSEHSVASDWVEKEVETALEKERKEKRTVLFPIRLDEAVMNIESGWPADVRRARHIGDFSQWKHHDPYKNAFERLLQDLKAKN